MAHARSASHQHGRKRAVKRKRSADPTLRGLSAGPTRMRPRPTEFAFTRTDWRNTDDRSWPLPNMRTQRRTPKIGPAVKVESAPDSEEEQTNEQQDEAAA